MEIIAIIPVRGGSKGIPGKNIIPIAGKPLIAHTILAAKKSNLINRLVVSTDDLKIADISNRYGAEVILRPNDISDDSATSESALLHVLRTLSENENYSPDLLVLLQCTAPLITINDIDGTIKKLLSTNADTAFAAMDFHNFIWKRKSIDNENMIGINHNKNKRYLRQEIKTEYLEIESVYVLKADGFKEYKRRFFGKIVAYISNDHTNIEINDLIAEKEFLIKNDIYSIKKDLPDEIEAVFFDFDGVFTDNKVYINEFGQETVMCDRGDGYGIGLLKKQVSKIAVFSTEENDVLKHRCNKLKIDCYNSLGNNKLEALKKYCAENNINLVNTVFVGNDINDIFCLKSCGCAIVPSDAHEAVKPYADIILCSKGGSGSVREVCDLIVSKLLEKRNN